MAASFPNAKKTFSQIVNGVTKLVASIFNVNYDETEAIETFIGATGGGAQSYSESLTNLLFNYRQGCNVEYKSTSDLYVRLGEMMLTDASGNRRLRRNTSDTTVTWAMTDAGAPANSTACYIYATGDDSETVFDVAISTSNTAPAGKTYYKKLGGFYKDGSGNITSVWDNVFPSDVYDYGTGTSSPTLRNHSTIKIAYGSVAIGNSTTLNITNLPFTSTSSYFVSLTHNYDNNNDTSSLHATIISGSSFKIYNTNALSFSVFWIAIGV